MASWVGRIAWLSAVAIWLSGAGGIVPSAAAQNPIVVENQQPGTGAWLIGIEATDVGGQIKGYASATSVNAGENLDFHISVSPAQTFTIDIYRIGWYQGLGGRLIQHVGPLSGFHQPTCPVDATTGMIACNWIPTYTLSTMSSWTSGIYLALLKNAAGYQNYIIFAVRNDGRTAALLYQQPVTTYQAYNGYPYDGATGKSLYEYNSFGANTVAGTPRAVKVSFDRPYAGNGSSHFLWWEINFVRWLERSGYDVSYSTNLDTHTNGSRLLHYKAFLSVGHDEYWSKAMFDAAEAARDNGVSLAFFGANAIDEQVRFEPSAAGAPNRVMVGYKDKAVDPTTDPSLTTIDWREDPVNRPQQTLIGIQYTSRTIDGAYLPYVVTNSTNWIYEGSGFNDGDSVPDLVGYEADRLFNNYPAADAVPGTYMLLSNSPYTTANNRSDYGNSSIYQAPSGAWVFGSGTMGWPWALDNYDGHTVDARLQRTTANLLDRFIANSPRDFALDASPATRTVMQGGSTSYDISIDPQGSFTGQVSLSLSGLPSGASYSFAPNTTDAMSTLSVTAGTSTPAGTYSLTITGGSGNLTRTATVEFVVAGSFALAASPSSKTVKQGASTTYSITVSRTSGFSNQVTLSLSGLPSGASYSFNPNPAGASSTLSVTAGTSTPAGTYSLTITGVSGSLTRTATVSFKVTGDFSVSASPASRTVKQGRSTTYTITISRTPGFTGQITMSLSGLPSGVSSSFSPNPATNSSTLTITAGAAAKTGTKTLTITGTNGSLKHTATVSLVVTK